jgi:multiple sugar transport system ATP-binding protein
MTSVIVSHLTKAYGKTKVLRDVTLSIAEGEFLTLLGPSGCGKSTLLRIIAGLESPDGGHISIGDRVVDGLRPKQRDVAMVFQSYALYPHMTAAQNIALPLRMRRLSGWQRLPLIGWLLPGTEAAQTGIERDVLQVAKSIGIDQLLDRKPGQLSGGQRQRVAVGRAMVRQPVVFLMDEPLSNLDTKLRGQMRAEIKELHNRLGVTFIYVTHDQSEAMTLSDRVAVMLDGQLLQVAPPLQIYADPANAKVAEFVGSPKINMLDGVVRGHGVINVAATTLAIDANATYAPTGATLTLGIRPEAFHLAQQGGPGVLTGTVRFIEHMGSDLFVHLGLQGVDHPLVARLRVEQVSQINLGHSLHLGVRADQMLLFASDGERIRTEATITPLREIA